MMKLKFIVVFFTGNHEETSIGIIRILSYARYNLVLQRVNLPLQNMPRILDGVYYLVFDIGVNNVLKVLRDSESTIRGSFVNQMNVKFLNRMVIRAGLLLFEVRIIC